MIQEDMKVKDRKDPGLDECHYHMLHYGNDAVLKKLCDFFNRILMKKKMPEQRIL